MNVSKKTIDKIKKEKIAPLPRWRFLLRNDLFWAVAAGSGLVGSVVVATIFHVALNRDWFIYAGPHRPSPTHLLLDLPLIWLLLFGVTSYIAYYNVYHSKSGYKYSPYLIVLASLVFSVVLGGLWNFYGIGATVETDISHTIPAYKSVEQHTEELWGNAEAGHLGGQITAIKDQNFELKDPSNKIWQVDVTGASCSCGGGIVVGEKVKIVGKETSESQFKAEQIRLWNDQGPRRLFRPDFPPPPMP